MVDDRVVEKMGWCGVKWMRQQFQSSPISEWQPSNLTFLRSLSFGKLTFYFEMEDIFERCRVLSLSLRRKMIDPFFKGRKEEKHWEEKRWFCRNCHHTGAAACNVFELQQLMGKSWRVFQVPPQIPWSQPRRVMPFNGIKTPTGPCTTTLYLTLLANPTTCFSPKSLTICLS